MISWAPLHGMVFPPWVALCGPWDINLPGRKDDRIWPGRHVKLLVLSIFYPVSQYKFNSQWLQEDAIFAVLTHSAALVPLQYWSMFFAAETSPTLLNQLFKSILFMYMTLRALKSGSSHRWRRNIYHSWIRCENTMWAKLRLEAV